MNTDKPTLRQYFRQRKETENLFADPQFQRQAWRSIGHLVLNRPACKPIPRYNKDGDETFESLVERYTYDQLMSDLVNLQDPTHTAPTELEMIMACQAQMARINASNFVAFRDTVGAKPVDESKIDHTLNNPYEELTDEELEMILAAREAKQAQAEQELLEQQREAVRSIPTTTPHDVSADAVPAAQAASVPASGTPATLVNHAEDSHNA